MSAEIFYSTDPAFCPHCKQIPCACNRLGQPKKQTEPARVRFAKTPKAAA